MHTVKREPSYVWLCCDNCIWRLFQRLIVHLWLIHFQCQLWVLSLRNECCFLSLQSSNCEGIVFWMHLWNCLSQGVLMHTFVGLNLQIVVARHVGIMQCKTPQKRTNREILKTECVGGLIRASVASFNTRGYFMLNGFVLLFSNLHCLPLAVESCLDPDQISCCDHFKLE